MKNIKFSIFIFLLFPFFLWGQEEEAFKEIDSLMKIQQPNKAKTSLLSILTKAEQEGNHATILKAIPYFDKVVYQMEHEERADLYFDLFDRVQALPEPSHSVGTLYLLMNIQPGYGRSWFPYNQHVSVYDSLDLRDEMVRFEFLKNHLENTEKQLDKLNEIEFKPYENVLIKTKDSIPEVVTTMGDYTAYLLIYFYQNRAFQEFGSLKNKTKSLSEWYATTDHFQQLDFSPETLTERVLHLFQWIEKNNNDNQWVQSTAAYHRLMYLSTHFSEKEKIKQAWENNFEFYNNSSSRSKFLYQQALLLFNQGKDYHFKENPTVEGDILLAKKMLKKELELYPRNDFSEEMKNSLSIIEQKYLSLNFSHQHFPGEKIPVKIMHRNKDKTVLHIYKVKDGKTVPSTRKSFKEYVEESKLDLVNVKTIELTNKGMHQGRSTELMLEGLKEQGKYFLVYADEKLTRDKLLKYLNAESWDSDNSQQFGFDSFLISSLTLQTSGFGNQLNYIVMDYRTGKPISGATVEIYQRKYNQKTPKLVVRKKTNENGWVIYEKTTKSGVELMAVVRYKDAVLEYSRGHYSYPLNTQQEVAAVKLITDRAIYRPHQTIHFKGIIYGGKENNFNVIPNQEIKITLRDANYQVVFEDTYSSNQFGSVNGEIELPSSLHLGSFTLVASSTNGKTNYSGNTSLRVEEYKRPTFEMKMNLPEEEAKINDTVNVSGEAKAFAGYPIANTQVEYTVYRNWNRYWYFMQNTGSGDKLVEGTTTTDENGEFHVSFFAEEDPNAFPFAYYTYQVKAKITDEAGETHEEFMGLNLSKAGVYIQLEGKGDIFTDDDEKLKVNVVNLSGKNQAGYEGKLSIYQRFNPEKFISRIWGNTEFSSFTKAEFEKLFPYMKWDTYEKTEDKKIKTLSFSSGEEFNINELIGGKQGRFVIKASTKTKEGDTISFEKEINIIDVKAKEIPHNEAIWAFVSKNEVEVGEKVDFQVGTAYPNQKALFTVYQNGEILERKWVDLKNRFSYEFTPQEKHRGKIIFTAVLYHRGKLHNVQKVIDIPFSNKEFKIKTKTFRDQLQPGEKEQWSFTIEDQNGKTKKAELAAAMYDASLDKFVGNSWSLWPYSSTVQYGSWAGVSGSNLQYLGHQSAFSFYYLENSSQHKFDFIYRYLQHSESYYRGPFRVAAYSNSPLMLREVAGVATDEVVVENSLYEEFEQVEEFGQDSITNTLHYPPDLDDGQSLKMETSNPRENFNETAFFYPTIYSTDTNDYVLNFTLPESLTKWKLLLLAHDKEMKVGALEKTIEAKKDVMITTNPPRFVRRGDQLVFSAKVVNLTDEKQIFDVDISLANPENDEILSFVKGKTQQNIEVGPHETKGVEWEIKIGEVDVIQYTITAENQRHSDGERAILSVLSNRSLVTETAYQLIREKGNQTVKFTSFGKRNSSTLEDVSYTVEYVDNLAWNAVMALPSLIVKNDKSITGLMEQLYAHSIAVKITQDHPQIKTIFEQWKATSPDVLLSELEKNEELKNILLYETPWVMDAKNETEQRRRIAQLFDINQVAQKQNDVWNQIAKRQLFDGGFSWFNGGRSSLFMTQYVLTKIGQLKQLGVDVSAYENVVKNAVKFTENEYVKWYKKHIKEKDTKKDYQLSPLDILWLHTQTIYQKNPSKDVQEIRHLFEESLKKNWMNFNPYMQAFIGMYFHETGATQEAQLIYDSFQDRAVINPKIGMYWMETSGFYWYQNKISTHAMIVSFYHQMGADEKTLDEARLWLILNKEANSWKTNSATSDAIYTILETGKSYLQDTKRPEIKVGKIELTTSSAENAHQKEVEWTPGLGEMKAKWTGGEIDKEMRKIEVVKHSEGPATLKMYWQYTEELDKISASNNDEVQVKKQYYKVVAGEKKEIGKEQDHFEIGDKIEVKITFSIDRDMEYLHLKDLRPAGFEPLNTTSHYNWSSNLIYYQSPKDASMDFFIERAEKGSYSLTYQVYATHKGKFNSGMSTLQNLYAPAFSGNSDAKRIEID